MGTSIFLSYPKPIMKNQEVFLEKVQHMLRKEGLMIHTLQNVPNQQELIHHIRKRMNLCDGMLMIAFQRTWIQDGIERKGSDLHKRSIAIHDEWFTSIWCQIEVAMAYQINLPILILVENGVKKDGLLECNKSFSMLDFTASENLEVLTKSDNWITSWNDWKLAMKCK